MEGFWGLVKRAAHRYGEHLPGNKNKLLLKYQVASFTVNVSLFQIPLFPALLALVRFRAFFPFSDILWEDMMESALTLMGAEKDLENKVNDKVNAEKKILPKLPPVHKPPPPRENQAENEEEEAEEEAQREEWFNTEPPEDRVRRLFLNVSPSPKQEEGPFAFYEEADES